MRTAEGLDPEDAPDLSFDGWPEKLAQVPVRRGAPDRASVRCRPEVRTPAVPSDSEGCLCMPSYWSYINDLSCYNVPSEDDHSPVVPDVFLISNR